MHGLEPREKRALGSAYAKIWVLCRHVCVCCIYFLSTKSDSLVWLLVPVMHEQPRPALLVVYAKIQRARDAISTNFCINLYNNIDEFYCFVSKPQNHL